MNNGVGGTVVYSAWLRRYMPGDFKTRSATIERYGEEAIPAGSSMVDWPIGYDDLEPYYTAVEKMIGVAGIPGNIRGKPVKGGNPYEGYRSEGYPLPPLRTAGLSQRFAEACESLGYHPYPVPAGINSVPNGGRPACTYCGYNAFFGCHIDAKSTVDLTFIPEALKTGNLEIRTECRVLRVTTDAKGNASGVDYIDPQGMLQHLDAPIVVLAAYTFENVRLMLLSTSDRFPKGLANRHGQVGKYFAPKQLPRVLGILPRPHGQPLHRPVGARDADRRFPQRQFRPHRAWLHPRRLDGRDPAEPSRFRSPRIRCRPTCRAGGAATRSIWSRTGTAISPSRPSPRA